MKIYVAALLLAAMPAVAQHEGHQPDRSSPTDVPPSATPPQQHEQPAAAPTPPAAHDMPSMPTRRRPEPQEPPPPAALSGPTHAADTLFASRDMEEAREQLRAEQGAVKTYLALADRFEAGAGDGRESYSWDLQGWYGGDIHKLWLKSEAQGEAGDNPDDIEFQALYSRAITPFFDFQAGVRRDFRGAERSHAVLGVQGLLPQVFDIEAAAFFSEGGDVTGRFEAEYDIRIKQRLVLQPRIEVDFAAQEIAELGIGSGVSSIEGGFRLRYEIRRELAPYVGVRWERRLGDTEEFARRAGEDPRLWEILIGVRSWF